MFEPCNLSCLCYSCVGLLIVDHPGVLICQNDGWDLDFAVIIKEIPDGISNLEIIRLDGINGTVSHCSVAQKSQAFQNKYSKFFIILMKNRNRRPHWQIAEFLWRGIKKCHNLAKDTFCNKFTQISNHCTELQEKQNLFSFIQLGID